MRHKPVYAWFSVSQKLAFAFSSTGFYRYVLWLNDSSYSKSVRREKRNLPARNTLAQLLALYTDPKSNNAQRDRQTDGQTDEWVMPVADHSSTVG